MGIAFFVVGVKVRVGVRVWSWKEQFVWVSVVEFPNFKWCVLDTFWKFPSRVEAVGPLDKESRLLIVSPGL
jgi:hypothetical protein